MPNKKVKLLLNVGWQDADGLGLSHLTAEDLAEGQVLDVDEMIAEKLVRGLKCAEFYDASKEMKAKAASNKPASARERFGTVVPPARQVSDFDDEEEDNEELDEEDDDGVESPLADAHADEAIDRIGRMRSAEKLQEIIGSDTRVTVQEAARKRLAEL